MAVVALASQSNMEAKELSVSLFHDKHGGSPLAAEMASRIELQCCSTTNRASQEAAVAVKVVEL